MVTKTKKYSGFIPRIPDFSLLWEICIGKRSYNFQTARGGPLFHRRDLWYTEKKIRWRKGRQLMEAEKRRGQILAILREKQGPVSASSLARRMGVSRQLIVGDIALLRAQGSEIIATARGYTMGPVVTAGRYIGKLACQHRSDAAAEELRTIVEQGGEVLDVIVVHELYGEITGQLGIATLADVDAFLRKVENKEARLLSELTGGVHLHTIVCRDADAFESVKAALERKSMLYRQ